MRKKHFRKGILISIISLCVALSLCGCKKKEEDLDVNLTLIEKTTVAKEETTARKKTKPKKTTEAATEETKEDTTEVETDIESTSIDSTVEKNEVDDFIEGVGVLNINGNKIEAGDLGLFVDDNLVAKGQIRSVFVTDGTTIYYTKVLEQESAIYTINIDGTGEKRIYAREDGMEVGNVFACKDDNLYFLMNVPGDTVSNCYTWKIGSDETKTVLESINNPYLYEKKIYWTSYAFDVSPVTLCWADINDFIPREISSQVGKYRIFEDKVYYSNMVWDTENDGYMSEIMRCNLDGTDTEKLSEAIDVLYDFEITDNYVIYKSTTGSLNTIYKREFNTQDETVIMETGSHVEIIDAIIGIYMVEMNQESGIHTIYKYNEQDNNVIRVKEIQLQSGHSFYITTVGEGYMSYQEYDSDYNLLGTDSIYLS